MEKVSKFCYEGQETSTKKRGTYMNNYDRLLLDTPSRDALSRFNLPKDLGFGKSILPIMAISEYKNGSWTQARIKPYEPLQLDPAARVLHYGQAIFEGMKAYNNEGKIALLGPNKTTSDSTAQQSVWLCQRYLSKYT